MHPFRFTAPVFAALVLLLSGCQSLPTTKDLADAQRPSYLRSWQAQGKISLRQDSERTNASFRWRQHSDNYIINLHGPFGQGATELRRTNKGVILENAEVGRVQADTAEELMLQMAGWQVPVSGLRHWITGMPTPDTEVEIQSVDDSGWPAVIVQDGWTIEFKERKNFQGYALPSRVDAYRDDIRVTLVARDWAVPFDIYGQ